MTQNCTNELHTLTGFVKLKKISKVGGWVKPQIGFVFFCGNVVFCVFLLLYMFSKKLKNLIGGEGVWCLASPSFFTIFFIFLT